MFQELQRKKQDTTNRTHEIYVTTEKTEPLAKRREAKFMVE